MTLYAAIVIPLAIFTAAVWAITARDLVRAIIHHIKERSND